MLFSPLICVCMCVCLYVYVCVCMYVCMCECLCIYVSNSVEPTDFTLDTNRPIQQHKVHLELEVKVTLTDAEGHR